MTTEVNFVTIKECIPQTISKLQSVSQHKKSLLENGYFLRNLAWQMPVQSKASFQFAGQCKVGLMQSNLCSLVFVLLTLILHRSITM